MICTMVLTSLSLSIYATETEREETMSIVEYNYSTKTEVTTTISLNDIKSENRQRIYSMDTTIGEIDLPYIPDHLDVETNSSTNEMRSVASDAWGPVGSTNVNVFPYSSILAMKIGWLDEDDNMIWYYGTGFLEGYDVVATAGHNMWDETYGWVDDCRFYVRQYSGTYSSTDYYHPKEWTCATNFTSDFDLNYDWCAITLWDDLGSSNGWFGKGWSQNDIDDKYITMSGYPLSYGIQYSGKAYTSDSTTYLVRYNLVVPQGTSGSPIYTSDHIVWAIQTHGYSSTKDEGNRITEWLYNILQNKFLAGQKIYG